MNKISIVTALLSVMFMSCQPDKHMTLYQLEATQKTISFPVSSNSSLFIKSLSLFTDSNNVDYLTFMSNEYPEIYVYDLHTQELVKTIIYQHEGPDGVGPKAGGYLMKDWNEIYVPNLFLPEISKIDSNGHKWGRIDLTAWKQSYEPIPTRSVISNPMFILQDKLYCMQVPNPHLGKATMTDSPVGLQIDLKENSILPLSFNYPSKLWEDVNKPVLGIERKSSQCLAENRFVCSFSFDEYIYFFTPGKDDVQKKQVKSSHIHRLDFPENIPTDLRLAAKMMCELPFYGNIVYDKYRKLYYRFAYPRTELGMDENFIDMWQFGRSEFSIIILDEEFNVVGETLLPKNQYRSNLYYITEEGLFLSESHSKNPSFNEDSLTFRLLEITDTKATIVQ